MIRFALAIAGALLASNALAQPRPSTTRMTCGAAAALVRSQGAVVLGTGGYTYDRFVRDRSFCEITEAAVSAYAPTLDTPQCFVGYRCKEPSNERFFDR